MWGGIFSAGGTALKAAKPIAKTIAARTGKLASSVGKATYSSLNSIRPAAVKAKDKIVSAGSSILGNIKSGITKTVQTLKDTFAKGSGSKLADKIYKAPSTGKDIVVKAKGKAVVPNGKVEQYMRGNVSNPKQELKELNAFKQNNRKLFDANPNNAERLEKLKELNHNYDRSIDMASKLESIGLNNTKINNDKIFNSLLDAGNKVSVNNRVITSIIEGPTGKLKMESRWSILPDGTKYMSTVKLIPIN